MVVETWLPNPRPERVTCSLTIVVWPVSFERCSAVSNRFGGKAVWTWQLEVIVSSRAITAFAAFELIDVLADQVAFDSVAGDEGQAFLQDLKFPECREFVNHSQEAMFVGGFRASVFEIEFISQEADDHVYDDPDNGFKPRFVVGFGNDI